MNEAPVDRYDVMAGLAIGLGVIGCSLIALGFLAPYVLWFATNDVSWSMLYLRFGLWGAGALISIFGVIIIKIIDLWDE